MDRDQIERRVREFFLAQPSGVVAAYLYGSTARGTAGADSDIDLGLLFERDPPPTFAGLPLALADQLEIHLGAPVDLVALNGCPVDLVHRVLRDGRLLIDRDPAARARFEMKARNEFFDLEPILREYRRMSGSRR